MSSLRTFLSTAPSPIAVLTPAVAANLDFLTTFDARFNAYRLIGMGLLPSADDYLRLRLAAAGSADTGSNYAEVGNDATTTTAVTSIQATATIESTGRGGGFILDVWNVNDATRIKMVRANALAELNTTPSWQHKANNGFYFAANAVTGGRLFWNAASNFQATGAVYVYPLAKV